ncbi:hypothetical protein OG563_26620 [Nocardia vinacea]|uniref:Uncharacterized protein n=1 Tax=Nocardia vinacea TaxID=96468 RepID=A0ABZ1YKJ1_9NOCA|nr:hypothetical protein [Nocardia vinacea]
MESHPLEIAIIEQPSAALNQCYLYFVASTGNLFIGWRQPYPDIILGFERTTKYAHVFV